MDRREFLTIAAGFVAGVVLPFTAEAITPKQGTISIFKHKTGAGEVLDDDTFWHEYQTFYIVDDLHANDLKGLGEWMLNNGYRITDEAVVDLNNMPSYDGYRYGITFRTNHIEDVDKFKTFIS